MPANPLRFGLGVSNCRPAGDVVATVAAAEEIGAEVAFVAEDVNCRDAFQLLALSAGRTERIRLSTGVVNPYTRNPTSLAMATATLDELSGGRGQLGLGTSSPSLIEDQMGIGRGSSVTVMREATEIVRGLLGGEVVTYRGEQFTYASAVLEARAIQSRVPVYLAAMGPKMLHLAGQISDGVLLNVGSSTEYVRWAVGQIEAGARSAGRDPAEVTIAAWMSVYLSATASTMQRAREWLASMLSVPRQGELLLEHTGLDTAILAGIRAHFHAYPHGGDLQAAAAFVPDDVVERLTLVGGPAAVRARLDDYRDAGVQVAVMGIGALRKVM